MHYGTAKCNIQQLKLRAKNNKILGIITNYKTQPELKINEKFQMYEKGRES